MDLCSPLCTRKGLANVSSWNGLVCLGCPSAPAAGGEAAVVRPAMSATRRGSQAGALFGVFECKEGLRKAHTVLRVCVYVCVCVHK